MFAFLGSKAEAGAGPGRRQGDASGLGICTRLFNLWLLCLAPLSGEHLAVIGSCCLFGGGGGGMGCGKDPSTVDGG